MNFLEPVNETLHTDTGHLLVSISDIGKRMAGDLNIGYTTVTD